MEYFALTNQHCVVGGILCYTNKRQNQIRSRTQLAIKSHVHQWPSVVTYFVANT